MITAIYTNTRLVVFGHGTPKGMTKLLNTELAGRSYPMTSTLHVFLNTIINRYKDEMTTVFYPLAINVVFPTESYITISERKHVLDYILDRKDVIRLRYRKSLMQASIEGWCTKMDVSYPNWIAVSTEDETTIGIKENPQLPLKIKSIGDIGRSAILKEFKEYVKSVGSQQEIQILHKVAQLGQKEVDQLLNSAAIHLIFPAESEIPDTTIAVSENFSVDILRNITNIIFLHINNLHSKLQLKNPVFFLGGFVNSPNIHDSLKQNGSEYGYKTIFINDEEMPNLAATSFANHNLTQTLSSKEHQHNISKVFGTTAYDEEIKQDSSAQSQTLEHKRIQRATTSKERVSSALLSEEFVIEHRFLNQEFLLFSGYRKSRGIRRFYRFISHDDYKSINRRMAYIKLYKKVKALYPEISTLVNTKAGQYYYLDDMGAKPLSEVIAQSRIRKGSDGNFKSEDIQLLIDIYKKLDELPITFQNLSADKIYIKEKEWWRSSQHNEVYFLGITSSDSTKKKMTKELDMVISNLVHPAIVERISLL